MKNTFVCVTVRFEAKNSKAGKQCLLDGKTNAFEIILPLSENAFSYSFGTNNTKLLYSLVESLTPLKIIST